MIHFFELLCYFAGFLNCIPFTCANCGLVAPKTDLMYFFTSLAVSVSPVVLEYNVAFLAIRELLTLA